MLAAAAAEAAPHSGVGTLRSICAGRPKSPPAGGACRQHGFTSRLSPIDFNSSADRKIASKTISDQLITLYEPKCRERTMQFGATSSFMISVIAVYRQELNRAPRRGSAIGRVVAEAPDGLRRRDDGHVNNGCTLQVRRISATEDFPSWRQHPKTK